MTMLLGAGIGAGCGVLIVTVGWILFHDRNETFEMAMYGIAEAGFLSGAKAGAICLPISRFVLLDKAGLKNTLLPLVVYTCIGGFAGLAFGSLKVAEVLAIGAFFLGSLNISQYRARERRGFARPGPRWK
ncbi:MAG: hypothetical protein JOY86_08095 [Candidatus Eremiobacteraeota bacterium]|nr:hypothetical protein [Candidatus Eremiobacteraeota bacterium]